MCSGAPLTTSSRCCPSSTSTEMQRRSKSKGTSSISFHRPASKACVRKDRVIERALDARFESAVDPRELENAFATCTVAVHVPLEADVCFGERAGLVGAQHVHRA